MSTSLEQQCTRILYEVQQRKLRVQRQQKQQPIEHSLNGKCHETKERVLELIAKACQSLSGESTKQLETALGMKFGTVKPEQSANEGCSSSVPIPSSSSASAPTSSSSSSVTRQPEKVTKTSVAQQYYYYEDEDEIQYARKLEQLKSDNGWDAPYLKYVQDELPKLTETLWKETDCSACLLDETEDIVQDWVTLVCGHRYHLHCLKSCCQLARKIAHRCTKCQREVDEDERQHYIRMYHTRFAEEKAKLREKELQQKQQRMATKAQARQAKMQQCKEKQDRSQPSSAQALPLVAAAIQPVVMRPAVPATTFAVHPLVKITDYYFREAQKLLEKLKECQLGAEVTVGEEARESLPLAQAAQMFDWSQQVNAIPSQSACTHCWHEVQAADLHTTWSCGHKVHSLCLQRARQEFESCDLASLRLDVFEKAITPQSPPLSGTNPQTFNPVQFPVLCLACYQHLTELDRQRARVITEVHSEKHVLQATSPQVALSTPSMLDSLR